MTIAVDMGRKARKTKKQKQKHLSYRATIFSIKRQIFKLYEIKDLFFSFRP